MSAAALKKRRTQISAAASSGWKNERRGAHLSICGKVFLLQNVAEHESHSKLRANGPKTQIILFLKEYWKSLILICIPIILLPIPLCWKIEPHNIAKCAYVVIIMGIFWVTEVLPLEATALIPLFSFPLLQILSAQEVANTYVIVSYFPLIELIVRLALAHKKSLIFW